MVDGRWPLVLTVGALICCGMAHAERTVDAALREAAQSGDLARIAQLMAQGADPDKSDALLAAIQHGQRPTLVYLLEHGADPNAWIHGRDNLPPGAYGSPAFQAAKLGLRQLLGDLQKHGADLNAASLEKARPAGDTALIVAARTGETQAARLLLEFGADVNHQTPSGDTALMQAIYAPSNAAAMVALLLKFGADPDLKNSAGKSPRSTAHWYGAAGIKEAIDQARPLKPFSDPDELDKIQQVLLYKAECDLSTADYPKRTSAAYERWRKPRTEAIGGIEANPEFQKLRAELLASTQKALEAPRETPEQRQDEAEYRSLCEGELIREFGNPARR